MVTEKEVTESLEKGFRSLCSIRGKENVGGISHIEDVDIVSDDWPKCRISVYSAPSESGNIYLTEGGGIVPEFMPISIFDKCDKVSSPRKAASEHVGNLKEKFYGFEEQGAQIVIPSSLD